MTKYRIVVVMLALFVLISFCFAETVEYYDENLGKTVLIEEDVIVVKFDMGATESEINTVNVSFEVTVISSMSVLKIYKVQVPEASDYDAILNGYRGDVKVESAEPNYISRTFSFEPNDEYFDSQWAVEKIEIDKAWDIETGSSGVIIAVLDTGIDLSHEDLQDNIISGYDFVNNDDDPDDDNGHGTTVAGIIGAKGNNSIGIAGVCWDCKIMPVKVMDESGTGLYYDLTQGIIYASDNGVKILNLSIGGYVYSDILKTAVDYAKDNGCLLIAGAGDDNTNSPVYPAAYEGVIGVASLDSDDKISSESNYGDMVDLYAPGEEIYTTRTNDDYGSESGSSMASAYVSGLAGLVLSCDSSLSSQDIITVLSNNSDYINKGYKGDYGFGRINAYRAVLSAKGIENKDIAIMDVNIIPETPVTGQEAKVEVIVQNQGNVQTEATNLRLYLDESEVEILSVPSLEPNEIIKSTMTFTP